MLERLPLPQTDLTVSASTQLARQTAETVTNPGLELLGLAMENVNDRCKPAAWRILRHLSFINRSSPRFLFNPNDNSVILDGVPQARSNLAELLNLALRRSPPIVTGEQHVREKKRLQVPGFYQFLKLLSLVGIPGNMFPSQFVADYIRKCRQ